MSGVVGLLTRRRWHLTWAALYPAAGLIILAHQTFVAKQAQYGLIAAALILCGLPATLNSDRFRQVLRELVREDDEGPR
jgi:hypothetical protein